MMRQDRDKENARLQLKIEKTSLNLQLEKEKRSPRSEKNVELKLGEKATNKLKGENLDLDMENVDWVERPDSAFSSVLGDFKCQNPEDSW